MIVHNGNIELAVASEIANGIQKGATGGRRHHGLGVEATHPIAEVYVDIAL
jgi:hypothetical protein